MKTLTSAIAVAAVAVGLGGGVATYALSAAPAEPTTQTEVVNASQTIEDSPSSSSTPDEPKVKFKPCEAPTHREGRNCVEDVVQTVELPPVVDDSPGQHHQRGHDDSAEHDGSGHPGNGHGDDDGDDESTDDSGHHGDEDGDHDDDGGEDGDHHGGHGDDGGGDDNPEPDDD